MTALLAVRREDAASATSEIARALAPVLEALRAIEARLEALERVTFPVVPAPPSTAEMLVDRCRELAIPITADGFVREHGAARLLNRASSTLRNWRYGDEPIPWRMLGGRIEYSLSDIAGFLDRAC